MNRIGCAVVLLVEVLAVQWGFGLARTEFAQQKGAAEDDRAGEITVKGTVIEVTNSVGYNGRMLTRLTLKSDVCVCQVHVGPSSYVSSQEFTFEKGDAIEVSGWNSKRDDQVIILAQRIAKGGKVLVLRDPEGSPLWALRPGLR